MNDADCLVYDNQVNVKERYDATIVTPTYNRKTSLKNMLESVSYQSYATDQIEVIIVDDGSSDGTDDMVKALDLPYRLRYFWQEDSGRRACLARNIGIRQSKGEVVIFIDSDAICSKELVKRHVTRHMENPKLILIGGIFDLHRGETIDVYQVTRRTVFWLTLMLLNAKKKQVCHLGKLKKAEPSTAFCSMNGSVRREALLRIKGFDEQFDGFWADEDIELGYRLALEGFKADFDFEAAVYHQWHPSDPTKPFYRRNRYVLLLKYPELLSHVIISTKKNDHIHYSVEQIKQLQEKEMLPEKIPVGEKIRQKLWVVFHLSLPGVFLMMKEKLSNGFGKH